VVKWVKLGSVQLEQYLFATEVSGVHVEDVVDAANGSYARLCHKYQNFHSQLSQIALA